VPQEPVSQEPLAYKVLPVLVLMEPQERPVHKAQLVLREYLVLQALPVLASRESLVPQE
jgi:hypothetical protein